MLEGRSLVCFTDHKPLTYALHTKSDKASPRQARHLSYISEFTNDIRHVSGSSNIVADTLSRIESIVERTPTHDELAIAQKTDNELNHLLRSSRAPILTPVQLDSGKILHCSFRDGKQRPYVPSELRHLICKHLHCFSHPGRATTIKLINDRYFWPHMAKYVTKFVKQCIECQRSKTHQHERTPWTQLKTPDHRFSCVHLDIVGPLPPSRGNRFLLTCIDRYSRWPEAIALPDQTAETVAKAFWEQWISRFGTPTQIITDQGRNFTSHLFQALTRRLGAKLQHTTAYHPQSNGLLERWHRTLKTALTCRLQTTRDSWTEHLPAVLLGLRSCVKEGLQCSPAELLYGTQLRLPGDYFNSDMPEVPQSTFVSDLANRIRQNRPSSPVWHSKQKIFRHQDLPNCPYVFLRDDSCQPPLTPSYTGPHKVIDRSVKTFTIELNGRSVVVSRDRLKPAYMTEEEKPKQTTPEHRPSQQKSTPRKQVTFADPPTTGVYPTPPRCIP